MAQGLIQNIDDVPGVLARVLEDHERIAEVLHRLEHQIDGLQGTEVGSRYIVLSRIVEYMSQFVDVNHHPVEDRMFDRLLHKGVSPAERHLVFSNLGQHQELLTANRALRAWLDRLTLNDAGQDASQLLEAAEAYLRQQRKHMAFEETHLFTLVQQHLQNSDWNALADELAESEDPEKHPEHVAQLAELDFLRRQLVAESVVQAGP